MVFFAAVALVACGDEIETSRSVDDSGVGLLALGETIDQLPCDESNKGKFVYVSDSSEVYYCIGGDWVRVNGTDGTDGKDGNDGKDGKDGKDATNGKDGTKCDVAGFEDGFTVLCGENKTVINLKNLMPDTCAISDETEKGFKVTCGKDSVWQKAGKDAKEPVRCTIADAGDGTALFVCGPDTVVVARAQCGGLPYDPDKFFCYNDEIADLCGGKTYDASTEFCHFGTVMDLCGGAPYDSTTRFCSNDMLYNKCGLSPYNTETEFCDNYRIIDKCENLEYNTLTHFCDEDSKKLHIKCGGYAYNLATQFCYNEVVYDMCGNQSYIPTKYFCENNIRYDRCGLSKPYETKTFFCSGGKLIPKCAGEEYDPKIKFCLDGTTYPKCGTNSSYDPAAFTCKGGVLYGKCGNNEYQVQKQVCVGTTLLDKCGTDGAYDPKKFFCEGGEMYPLCKGQKYVVQEKFCRNDVLYGKCGGEDFDPDVYFCANGTLVPKCDGQEYDTETFFCIDDKLNKKCGKVTYDIEKSFCENGKVYPLCGSSTYNTKNQFCFENNVYDYCDGHIYSPKEGGKCVDGAYYYDIGTSHYFVDFRDNRIYSYVTVGKLKWMVDYLKIEYTKETTQCPYKQEFYCNSNGRLYTWSAVMDSLGRYSATTKGSGYGVSCKKVTSVSSSTKVRGICPEGWRLPMSSEVPRSSEISSSKEGIALGIKGPGHASAEDHKPCNFLCSAIYTSSCMSPQQATVIYMSYSDNTYFYRSNWSKADLTAVRCVRDN